TDGTIREIDWTTQLLAANEPAGNSDSGWDGRSFAPGWRVTAGHPDHHVSRLLALPPGLPARPGGAGLPVSQSRDLQSDHTGGHTRTAAVGHRNVLDAGGRNAGAHSAQRQNGGDVCTAQDPGR